MSAEGAVHLRDRRPASPRWSSTGPQARNAMTWAMYERARPRSASSCAATRSVRVATLPRRRRRGLRRRHRHRAVPGVHRRRGRRRLRAPHRRRASACWSRCRCRRWRWSRAGASAAGWRSPTACDFRIATPGAQLRRADRAHAGQLPVDGQRGAPGGGVRPAARRSACCCWPRPDRRRGGAGLRLPARGRRAPTRSTPPPRALCGAWPRSRR